LEAELRSAREERDAAKLTYERGNKTGISSPLLFKHLDVDIIKVEQKRLSERQDYQNELLELRRRREEVESRLKLEGAKPNSDSCSRSAESLVDNSTFSDHRNVREVYGNTQMGYGYNQPPGAYWHDPC
jgi:hypothetical protein